MKTNTLRKLAFSLLAALTLSSLPAMAAPEEVKIDEATAAAKALIATMKAEESMAPALEGAQRRFANSPAMRLKSLRRF